MHLPDNKFAFVNTRSLMELVDSILVFLCAEDNLSSFQASDILSRQQGDIKEVYCKE